MSGPAAAGMAARSQRSRLPGATAGSGDSFRGHAQESPQSHSGSDPAASSRTGVTRAGRGALVLTVEDASVMAAEANTMTQGSEALGLFSVLMAGDSRVRRACPRVSFGFPKLTHAASRLA